MTREIESDIGITQADAHLQQTQVTISALHEAEPPDHPHSTHGTADQDHHETNDELEKGEHQ